MKCMKEVCFISEIIFFCLLSLSPPLKRMQRNIFIHRINGNFFYVYLRLASFFSRRCNFTNAFSKDFRYKNLFTLRILSILSINMFAIQLKKEYKVNKINNFWGIKTFLRRSCDFAWKNFFLGCYQQGCLLLLLLMFCLR